MSILEIQIHEEIKLVLLNGIEDYKTRMFFLASMVRFYFDCESSLQLA